MQMSLQKLSKQLKRELKANPQKAGMLGVLVLVAGWFWGPLVFKSEEKKKTPAVAASATTPTTAGATTSGTTDVAAVPSTAGKERMDWRELSSRLQSESAMTSVFGNSVPGKSAKHEARNPFDAPVITEVEPEEDELYALLEAANEAGLFDDETKPVITKEMNSAALNAYPLQLSSTLVGSRARTAIINGKAYPQGKTIGKINEVELVLEYVDPRSATIAWNGAKRELRIPKPGENDPNAPTDEMQRPENEQPAKKQSARDDEDRDPTQTSAEVGEFLGFTDEADETGEK